MSEEEAYQKVNNTKNKVSNRLKQEWKVAKESGKTIGGWSKKHFIELGMSEEDAKIEVKKRAISRETKMFVHRQNAKETGIYKLYSPTCIEYYLNKGLSEEESKNALKKRQTTNTIENYIKKYGIELGTEKFLERNKNWSLNMEEKYHNGEYNRDSNKNGNAITNRNYSNCEKELCSLLYSKLKEKCIDFKIYSIINGSNQWFLFENKRYYFYDIVFFYKNSKKIIEFNGDFWHMNPNIYSANDYNNVLNKTAQEIWDYFDEKIMVANKNNFETYVIWESDWKKNKELIIDNCIKFLINE